MSTVPAVMTQIPTLGRAHATPNPQNMAFLQNAVNDDTSHGFCISSARCIQWFIAVYTVLCELQDRARFYSANLEEEK